MDWDGEPSTLDEYLTTYFKLVYRTVGDDDTLEIMQIHSNFNTELYSFFTESPKKANELISKARGQLRDGWPGYMQEHDENKRNALQPNITVNGKPHS